MVDNRRISVDRTMIDIITTRVGEKSMRGIVADLLIDRNDETAHGRIWTALGSWDVQRGYKDDLLTFSATIDRGVQLDSDGLTINRPIPQSVAIALAGSPLRDLIVHPLLPEDATIASVTAEDDRTIVSLEREVIDAASIVPDHASLRTRMARRWASIERGFRLHQVFAGTMKGQAQIAMLAMGILAVGVVPWGWMIGEIGTSAATVATGLIAAYLWRMTCLVAGRYDGRARTNRYYEVKYIMARQIIRDGHGLGQEIAGSVVM